MTDHLHPQHLHPRQLRPQRLRRRLYALAFVDEFGPLYALYTLWFVDNGATASQVSTVFVLWAAVAIVLEVPSGAVADRVDRRHLLAFAFGLRAVGIAAWLLAPTYTWMLIGAAAWAVHSALASGAWEAQIHDQLTAIDEADRYATVMARVGQFSNLGVAAGTVVAFGSLALGSSIEALGWITVAIHGASIAIVLTLPNVRWVAAEAQEPGHDQERDPEPESTSYRAWVTGLRAGIAEATGTAVILRIVLLGAFLEGLFVIDEYVPLLARNRGIDDSIVPLFVLVVWVGLLAGDEVVARRPNLKGQPLGLAVAVGAIAMLIAVWSGTAAALLLVGVGYAALEALWVSSDARLQERVGSRNRATVTSVRGLLSGLISAAAFAIVAGLSDGDDPAAGLIVVLAVLAAVGVATMVWLPNTIRLDRSD